MSIKVTPLIPSQAGEALKETLHKVPSHCQHHESLKTKSFFQ